MNIFGRFWHKFLGRPHKLAKTVDIGSGDETVLLIHGLGTSGKTWKPLVKNGDKKKYHFLGYDLVGFGKSPKPTYSEYNVHDHASSLIASLERKVKRGTVTIIGHSMGCLIASHIAYLRPDMVKRMVLYEPPLFADSSEFRSHSRRKKLYFAFYQQLLQRPKILISYSKAAAKLKLAQGRNMDVSKQSWLPFERSLKNTIMEQKSYNELKAITVPTDIIYGKFDFVVTRTDVTDMLEENKSIKFHLVNEMHDVTERASKYILKILKTA